MIIEKLDLSIKDIIDDQELNKLCLFNYDNGDKFENRFNNFVCKDNEILTKRKAIIQKSINRKCFEYKFKLDLWRSCVDIINDETHGGKIISIIESGHDIRLYMKSFAESLMMLRNWMTKNNQDVYCNHSIFNVYGKKNFKYIESMIYDVFSECDNTLYILK